jgi:hypothetical protein
MSPISELVTSKLKLVSTSNKLTSNSLSSLEIKERALIIADGLTSTVEPNDMTAWYCDCFKKLGESKYTAIAKTAFVKGVPRPKLFGWLLKEEMKKLTTR